MTRLRKNQTQKLVSDMKLKTLMTFQSRLENAYKDGNADAFNKDVDLLLSYNKSLGHGQQLGVQQLINVFPVGYKEVLQKEIDTFLEVDE